MVFASDWKNRSCVCRNEKCFVQTADHDLFDDNASTVNPTMNLINLLLSEIYSSDLKIRVNLMVVRCRKRPGDIIFCPRHCHRESSELAPRVIGGNFLPHYRPLPLPPTYTPRPPIHEVPVSTAVKPTNDRQLQLIVEEDGSCEGQWRAYEDFYPWQRGYRCGFRHMALVRRRRFTGES